MKLGLGTVQFGINYGVSNNDGKTSSDEVKKILQYAGNNGVNVIDTAYLYGDSEAVIGGALSPGQKFNIVTKTSVYKKEKITADDAVDLKRIFNDSLKKLKQPKIYALLIHNADDLLKDGGELLYSVLLELKEKKLVDKIGVSVYTPDQIDRLLGKYNIDIIQVPVNVFDQRLIKNNYLVKLKEKNVEIHVRSIFLQGLLLMELSSLNSFFDPIKPVFYEYKNFLLTHGLTPVEGAFCFIKKNLQIDNIIIGVDNLEQLKINLNSFNRSYDDCMLEDFTPFILNDERYLNPSLWRL